MLNVNLKSSILKVLFKKYEQILKILKAFEKSENESKIKYGQLTCSYTFGLVTVSIDNS